MNRVFATLRHARAPAAVRRFGAVTGGHGHGHGHEGGHGGHPVHAPLGPYDVPHHATYPDEAHFLGIDPNKPYEYEGWEWITGLTYMIVFGVIVVGCNTRSYDTFKTWAKEEAQARRTHISNGGEVTFGTWYSVPEYEIEEGDLEGKPVEKEKE
ncbi:hypothetical protein B484DRAFT_400995 [Ochromonadaceae sp. CCMP2298]|nr:hypothetical protein B484DRAFT_400995 [Ochromonadaceae sp. CCMP2298]